MFLKQYLFSDPSVSYKVYSSLRTTDWRHWGLHFPSEVTSDWIMTEVSFNLVCSETNCNSQTFRSVWLWITLWSDHWAMWLLVVLLMLRNKVWFNGFWNLGGHWPTAQYLTRCICHTRVWIAYCYCVNKFKAFMLQFSKSRLCNMYREKILV